MANVVGTQLTVSYVNEYILNSGVDCWQLMLVNEKGVKWPYVFPKFTLEQRAAEYDMDPLEITPLLDMVLHEPHIPDPTDYRNFSQDAAAKSGMTIASPRGLARVRPGDQVPVHLYNAPDQAMARQAHLARVAEVKSRIDIRSGKGAGILSKGDTTDPLHTILDNHGVDPDRVKARASYVRWVRAAALGQGDPSTRVIVASADGLPSTPMKRLSTPYDASVRRRGLTVALLDSPRE